MSTYKKIIAMMLFLVTGPIYAAQQYVIVQCAMDPDNGKFFYSDFNTGNMIQVKSCGEALSKVPASYKLLSHDASSPATSIYGSNTIARNGYIIYLFNLN